MEELKYRFNCPACGFIAQQEFHTCPKCGVILEKYIARQSERAQREARIDQERIGQAEKEIIAEEYIAITDEAGGTAKRIDGSAIVTYVLLYFAGMAGLYDLVSAYVAIGFSDVKQRQEIAFWLFLAAGPMSTLPATMVAFFNKRVGGCWLTLSGLIQLVFLLAGNINLNPALRFALPSLFFGISFLWISARNNKLDSTHTEFVSAAKMIKIIVLVTLIVSICLLVSCGVLRIDQGFCGKIINRDTNEPISGAVVIANWKSINPFPPGVAGTDHKVSEVATDIHGEFCLKGAGLVLLIDEPGIVAFKAGYDGLAARQLHDLKNPSDANRFCDGKIVWKDGKATIMLTKLSMAERVEQSLGFGLFASGDKFKNFRKLFDSELNKEREERKIYKDQIAQNEQKRLMELRSQLKTMSINDKQENSNHDAVVPIK